MAKKPNSNPAAPAAEKSIEGKPVKKKATLRNYPNLGSAVLVLLKEFEKVAPSEARNISGNIKKVLSAKVNERLAEMNGERKKNAVIRADKRIAKIEEARAKALKAKAALEAEATA